MQIHTARFMGKKEEYVIPPDQRARNKMLAEMIERSKQTSGDSFAQPEQDQSTQSEN